MGRNEFANLGDEIKDAVRERLPERFHELNFRALAYVREHPAQD